MSRVRGVIFEKNLIEISGFVNIPEGWETLLIQDIFEIGRGRVISQNEINEHPGNYPVYSSQSFNNGVMGTIDSFDFEGEYLTWTTDGAYAGTVFHRKGRFNCTNVCGTLKANEKKAFTKFFDYHLGRISKRYVSYVGNPKLMNDIMANIAITVPPLPTQRKIARILSTADAVIEKTQAAIAKYKAIKQGMLHDLFTRGIDHATNKLRPTYEDALHLYKQSKLGWIPKVWDILQLEEITDYVDYRGKTPPKSEFGVYLVTARNIKDGYIDYEISKEYIREDAFESAMSRGKVRLGDVVITTEAPMGNVAQIDKEDIALAQRVIKYRGHENKLNNDYLANFLMSDIFQRQLYANATGSTVLGIRGSRLHKLSAYVPEINEQVSIVKQLKTIDNKLQSEQSYLQKLQQIKVGLMADLLSGNKEVIVDEEPSN